MGLKLTILTYPTSGSVGIQSLSELVEDGAREAGRKVGLYSISLKFKSKLEERRTFGLHGYTLSLKQVPIEPRLG